MFFYAKVDVDCLVLMLRALKTREMIHFVLTSHGLEFTISPDSAAPFTTAYLPRKICEMYDYNYPHINGEENAPEHPEEYEINEPLPAGQRKPPYPIYPKHGFGIHLGTMLDCLTIFGNNPGSVTASSLNDVDASRPPLAPGAIPLTHHHSASAVSSGASVKMAYTQQGSYLEMMLEHDGLVTVCKIITYEAETPEAYQFTEANKAINKIIIKSKWLEEALTDVEDNMTQIGFFITPERPYFKISMQGTLGTTEMSYTLATDVIEYFSCDYKVHNHYRLPQVLTCTKALSFSNRTAIRSNAEGWLSLQFMIPLPDPPAFKQRMAEPGQPLMAKQEGQQCTGFVELAIAPVVAS